MKRASTIFLVTFVITQVLVPIYEAQADRGGGASRGGGGGADASRSVSRSAPASRPGGASASQSVSRNNSYNGSVRQSQVRSNNIDGENGVVVAGDEIGVVSGERGTVVVGENGGAVANGEGGVIVGEDAFAVKGENRAVIGVNGEGDWDNYEVFENSDDYWRFVAGATTVVAIGAMFANPPTGHEVIVVGATNYYYHDHVFYNQIYQDGNAVYQVCAPPIGAAVRVLPAGCRAFTVGSDSYYHWADRDVYYRRSGDSYTIVAKP